jgi:hypothetical protein
MHDHADRSRVGTLEEPPEIAGGARLPEDRASRILERAAALDAKRSSEIEVEQLWEAAAQAGISREAFDEALAEHARPEREGRDRRTARAPRASEVAYYADLLRDLLGEDAQIGVVEDRIESRDGDGVTVSITPSSGEATAAVVAEGNLRRRLLALTLPALLVVFTSFLVLIEEDEFGGGMLLGVLLAVVASAIGTVISHRRERKALRKKAERLRRQLQRLLLLPPPDAG